MADFIERLVDAVEQRRDELSAHLRVEATEGESEYEALVRRHWSPVPKRLDDREWQAYAIDGSVRAVGLDNGSTVAVVQALCIGGGGFEEPAIDVNVLSASMPRQTASRVVDLLQQNIELGLACDVVEHSAEPGSVVFLDGALYGRLPHLFPLALEDAGSLDGLPERILTTYLRLLDVAKERSVRLIAVSKTSREATHFKLWRRSERAPGDTPREASLPLTDSEMIHRWTDRAAGVSTPVLLGKWSFTGGSRSLLEREGVAESPAIASCFIRLADFDDALRVDAPAHQLGSSMTLGELEGEVLPGGVEAARPLIDALVADYGGSEVYNALLYGVDREVRLARDVATEVYLPMIGELLGCEVRMNRSERRF